MPLIHDAPVRQGLETRLQSLRPDSRPRWGKMSVDQMLWHVNQAMEGAMGRIELDEKLSPWLRPFVRFFALHLPWPKNAPTNSSLVATRQYDFQAERRRTIELMSILAGQPVDGPGHPHPAFGRLTTRQASQLMAKHLDFHLTQFGC